MNAFTNSKIKLPSLISNISPRVYLECNYFKQNRVKISNINVINIYCVYELKEITSSRNNEFTIQNALFGVVKITKNTDTSKNKYEGYGICFDGSKTFTHTQKEGNSSSSTLARNVIIFGADISFSKHTKNKANNIYVMGKDHIQKINDTTTYAEKNFHTNFTRAEKKFVLSLHYYNDDSYLFANGRQELQFKTKNDQMSVEKKLCLSNLSSDWTGSVFDKTGLWGNIYDFVVDYKSIVGTAPIYDMPKYLMIKPNII